MPLARWFWPLVILLLLIEGALQVASIGGETQTWDEAFHLAAGYSYWRTGDFRMGSEQPPFAKMLNALPLLLLDPDVPVGHPSWAEAKQVGFGYAFLYENRIAADVILFAGRVMTIVLTLALGLAVALVTRRVFGPIAALSALFFLALDPNFIAHGRYVTTDLAATLFYFLACTGWIRYIETGRARHLALAGLWLGLALDSKHSCVVLIPVTLLLAVCVWRKGVVRLAAAWIVMVATACLVILLVAWPAWRDPKRRRVPESIPAKLVRIVDHQVHTSTRVYKSGLSEVLRHNRIGHQAYLLGQVSQFGWWYYFPVAMAVKTPLAALLLLPLAAFGLLRRGWRREYAFLLTPPALFLAVAMAGNLNLGIRHILPVYPFLYLLLGAGIAALPLTRARQAVMLAACLLQTIEVARIHPHYLAFFNLAAGGPEAGPRYLVDSNIDWGQDLKKLKRYMQSRGISDVCIVYFGNAHLDYYGVGAYGLPKTWELNERASLDCLAAASVTPPLRSVRPARQLRLAPQVEARRQDRVFNLSLRPAKGQTMNLPDRVAYLLAAPDAAQ